MDGRGQPAVMMRPLGGVGAIATRVAAVVSRSPACGSAWTQVRCHQMKLTQNKWLHKKIAPSGTVKNPNNIEGLDVKIGDSAGMVTPDPANMGAALHREEFIRVAELDADGGYLFYHPVRRVKPTEGRDTRDMRRLKKSLQAYSQAAQPSKEEIQEMRELRANDSETWTVSTLAKEFNCSPRAIFNHVPLQHDQFEKRKEEDAEIDTMRYHRRKQYMRKREQRLNEQRERIVSAWRASKAAEK